MNILENMREKKTVTPFSTLPYVANILRRSQVRYFNYTIILYYYYIHRVITNWISN